jgi:hypothetical protein
MSSVRSVFFRLTIRNPIPFQCIVKLARLDAVKQVSVQYDTAVSRNSFVELVPTVGHPRASPSRLLGQTRRLLRQFEARMRKRQLPSSSRGRVASLAIQSLGGDSSYDISK